MKTVKTSWNLGNNTVALSAQITPEQEEILLSRGLLHAGQRESGVDVVLGIVTVGDDGKKTRSKLTRVDVPYSPEKAKSLAELFGKLEIADNVVLDCEVSVTPYVREDNAGKLATEMAVNNLGVHESAGDLEAWLLAKASYAGPTHTDDGENFHPEAIAAVIPLAKARIAQRKEEQKLEKL